MSLALRYEQRLLALERWSPLRIGGPSDLLIWLAARKEGSLYQDAAMTTPAVADLDPIGGWRDISGNGRHVTQATAAARPILKPASVGGRRSVRFDGVDDLLTTAVGLGLSGDLTITAFIVILPTSATREEAYWGFGGAAVALDGIGLYSSPTFGGGASGKYSVAFSGANNYNASAANSVSTQIMTVKKSPGAINTTTAVTRNGVLATDGGLSSTGTPAVVDNPLHVGSFIAGNNKADAHVAELLIYNRALSAGQQTQVERYLSQIYGVVLG